MIRIAGVACISLALISCATSAETCDPARVNDVVTSARCGAMYQKRVEALEVRIAEIEREQVQAEAEARAAQAHAAALGADRAHLETQVRSLDSDIARLRLQLSGLRRENAEQERLADAMRRQIDSAEKELAGVRTASGPTPQDVDRLASVVQSKKDAYLAFLSLYETVE